MFKEFNEVPVIPEDEYFAKQYPYLSDAYLHWGIHPVAAITEGLAATPSVFVDTMQDVISRFCYSENSMLEEYSRMKQIPFPPGLMYHRHGMQTFRFGAWALHYLLEKQKVSMPEMEQFGFLVGTLVHDFLRCYVRATPQDKTSQLSTDESIRTLMSTVKRSGCNETEWEHIIARVVHYKNQTRYDEQGRWLAFQGPHFVQFTLPTGGLTAENILDILVPWCDIASQVTLPGYRLLRWYDLNFPWALDIPEGFKDLLRALEHYDWQLSNILPEPYRENLLNLLGLGLPTASSSAAESTAATAAETGSATG